ncbi:hypothetical protein [Burkholderia sola]|uniref:hypothetical protein n=1 Tax=Burkholderia sola TaxID=2843302 RepID=UPI0023DDC5CA|nr:hypothetical protein [Burkholderia sola]MDF3081087.1 hypothetical protein [Burkholderia sola]
MERIQLTGKSFEVDMIDVDGNDVTFRITVSYVGQTPNGVIFQMPRLKDWIFDYSIVLRGSADDRSMHSAEELARAAIWQAEKEGKFREDFPISDYLSDSAQQWDGPLKPIIF